MSFHFGSRSRSFRFKAPAVIFVAADMAKITKINYNMVIICCHFTLNDLERKKTPKRRTQVEKAARSYVLLKKEADKTILQSPLTTF